MTKGNFFRYYRVLSGADRYLIIFRFDGYIWAIDVEHIKPSWTIAKRESGGKANPELQKYALSAAHLPKKSFTKSAICLMTEEELEVGAKNRQIARGDKQINRGYFLEDWLCANMGATPCSSNQHERFDKCGDIWMNGKQYQVKFENASLTNVRAIHNAQADARAARKGAK